ncbi:M48 family metallopeptidase [Nitrosophilus kaiyonis]|uniref:M48 family metallopeptidase n=1 Tax=Nitrosophilus kaiyonis TaxID=2930200 RepID=UPI00248F6B19|nr:M48 family metallopeptidase [Nitrosophilus kaiyonis]
MKRLLVTILFPIFFLSCAKNPYINRSQLILISPSQEIQLGLQAKQEILKKQKLSKDPYYNELVKKVSQRIAKVAEKEFHPNFQWEFYVLKSKEINAFCLPGGKIFVYTGLLKIVDNEDQLATVIGHEVAHAILRHGSERASIAMVSSIARDLVEKGLNVSSSKWGPLFDLAYGVGSKYGIIYPYSRKFEYEADQVGLYLMYKACYDLNEAIRFWQKMIQISKKNIPEFLSTHPSDIHRIERIKKYIKYLKTLPRDCY